MLNFNGQLSLCSVTYVRWKRGTLRICCCASCCDPVLPRRQPCSNWSLSPTRRGHTAANPPHDRQTDRLTVCRCMNPAPYTMHAGSANKDENAHEFYVPHFYISSDILRASSSYFSTDSRYTWHRSQDLLWSIRPVSDLHSAQKNSVLLCSVTGFLIFGVKHSKNMTWSKISLIIW